MNHYMKKIQLVNELRTFLERKGFLQVNTPILRKDSGKLIRRISLENFGNEKKFALRDSHELTLRWLLAETDSVFEIGSCFRMEADISLTNAMEFLLMELFTTKYNLEGIKSFLKEFILSYKPNIIFEEISIADHIKKDYGVDLRNESQEELYIDLKEHYGKTLYKFDYEYVLHYIEDVIEPLSKGKIVFFTDYPECTCSYAKIKVGNVLSRFELFADGLEIANGFDDECNSKLFAERNRELPIFRNEEAEIVQGLLSGKLPSVSAGLGIGIERLCMFLFDCKDINKFAFPSDVF